MKTNSVRVRFANERDVDWLAAHRLGYRDTGAPLLPGEALEILLMKGLDQ